MMGRKALDYEELNENVKKVQYAVRGELYLRASDLQKEGKRIIFTNVGNPHALGQKPLTFPRQVVALCQAPFLLDDPNVGLIFPADAIARAKHYLSLAPGGLGAYSDSRGIPGVRKEVAQFIERRDGYPSDPELIYLTDGASKGVMQMLNTIIRNERDGILVPVPQYPLYSAAISLFGGSLVPYYLEEEANWGLDLVSTRQSVVAARSKGITVRAMVIINPGNPTGQCLSEANIRELLNFCYQENLVLLADEVYQQNVYQDERPFISARKGRLGTVCARIKNFAEGALADLLASERSVVAVCQRRQTIFDRLLATYAASQRNVTDLKRQSDAQASEISELKAVAAALPEVKALKKKVAELEGQLGERNTQLDATTQECDRLRLVENELNETIKRLTAEVSSLKTAHQEELSRLLEARTTVEDSLQRECDEAVRRLEATTEAHRQALCAARTQAEVLLAGMHEMDDAIADSWPASQGDAEQAVAKNRRTRREAGVVLDDTAPWSPDELILATRVRLPLVKGALCAFRTGVQKVNRMLLPGAPGPSAKEPAAPDTTADVVKMLKAAPRRIRALLDSAARAGAQTAIAIAVSWYPGLDLSLLSAMRAESDADLNAVWVDINHRSADISAMLNLLEYAPYLDDRGAPIPAATMSDLLLNSDDDTTEGSRPCEGIRSSSSSSAYHDSYLEGESSASSTERSGPPAASETEPPAAPQPEAAASPPTSTAPPPETTVPPSDEETASGASTA